MIKIFIDSTTDLPKEIMKQYDISMVPLQLHLKGKDYLDKETISVEELYQEMRQGVFGKTSQPAPAVAYNRMYKDASVGNNIIFLTISSKLSGTYQTISMVSEQIKEDFPNVDVEVIDSKGGSGATGLMALQAAKLITAGHNFKKIIDVMYELVNHVENIFTVANLKYIIKSGRINKTEALIGNILKFKPILHIENGQIKMFKKVRGFKKSLCTIVDIVEERIKNFPNQIIGIMHADDFDVAKQLEGMLANRLGSIKVIIEKIGSTVGTHIGIGGVGVFFFNKKPSLYII